MNHIPKSFLFHYGLYALLLFRDSEFCHCDSRRFGVGAAVGGDIESRRSSRISRSYNKVESGADATIGSLLPHFGFPMPLIFLYSFPLLWLLLAVF